MDKDKTIYNLKVGQRTFVMVEFPGISTRFAIGNLTLYIVTLLSYLLGLVKNPTQAVQCLGGHDKLDQVSFTN